MTEEDTFKSLRRISFLQVEQLWHEYISDPRSIYNDEAFFRQHGWSLYEFNAAWRKQYHPYADDD